MADQEQEVWLIPVIVYDEITAKDTAQVFQNMGYITSPDAVYRQVDVQPE